MTRVDFYVLPEGSGDSMAATASKLCDKAASAGHRIYINAPDAAQAEDLDGLLWSLRQGSFLSHERYNGGKTEEPPPYIYIGSGEPPESHHGVLINLGHEVPAYFSRFERVCEIVGGDPAQRASSRTRYKFYRDRGYELNKHDL